MKVNIAIMRAFVKLRQTLETNRELARKFSELERRVDKHDDGNRRNSRGDPAVDGAAGKSRGAKSDFMCAKRQRVIGRINAHDRLDDLPHVRRRSSARCFCRARLRAGSRCLRPSQVWLLGHRAFVGTPIADLAHFTTIVRVPWVPALGMNYHLALDGVSLTMVLVTGISAVSTVLFSWDVDHRQNEFFFWLLLVVGGCYGVFLSADLFLLFVFYELVIVPKYFLIAIFGSTNKEYGAMKLTLYSFFGGMFVFVGILVAYVTAGSSGSESAGAIPIFTATAIVGVSGVVSRLCCAGRHLAIAYLGADWPCRCAHCGFDVARGNCDETRLLCRSACRDESFSARIPDVEQMDRCARRDRNCVCGGSGASPT